MEFFCAQLIFFSVVYFIQYGLPPLINLITRLDVSITTTILILLQSLFTTSLRLLHGADLLSSAVLLEVTNAQRCFVLLYDNVASLMASQGPIT